jgi:DNA helicase-2/ATP-dependent DNA helicase PcrA
MNNAKESFKKTLFSDRSDGQKPKLIRSLDNHHESLFIIETIEKLNRQGIPSQNMAVLFHSGYHSYDLETKLAKRRIPFKKYGGIQFGQKAHIKDVLALLKIGMNDKDIINWHRVLTLFPGIKSKKAKEITDRLTAENGIECLREKGLTDLYHLIVYLNVSREGPGEKIRRIAEFYRPLFEANEKCEKKRWADIEALINMAANYLSNADFINSVVMNGDGDENSEGKEYLTLSTIHSAKGLEWDVVFIICVNDGCIPYFPQYKSPEEMDEEFGKVKFHIPADRKQERRDHINEK